MSRDGGFDDHLAQLIEQERSFEQSETVVNSPSLVDEPELSALVQQSADSAYELEAALAQSRADLDAGRFVKESVDRHIKRLAKLR